MKEETYLKNKREAALRRVTDFTGVALDDRPESREKRRAFTEWKRAANVAAGNIGYWRDALIPETNARKIDAAETGDDEALARAASLCNVIENGSQTDVIHEFIRHRASDPADVARLIAAGREHGLESRRITEEVVRLLAAAERSRDAA